jgi:quinol monooxygenase YgiN
MKVIATVRGKLKDVKDIQRLHDETARQAQPIGKSLGNISHHPYLNAQNPREFFDVDVWENKEGMEQFFNDPKMGEVFGTLFEERPEINFYTDAGWYRW